jgi:hypothetical protein
MEGEGVVRGQDVEEAAELVELTCEYLVLLMMGDCGFHVT